MARITKKTPAPVDTIVLPFAAPAPAFERVEMEPALPAPPPAPVRGPISPIFLIGTQSVGLDGLFVGAMGTCSPADLFVAPPGHPRFHPRSLTARPVEFMSDIAKRGVEEPLLVALRDGQVEVVGGHGRRMAALAAGLSRVPFRVVESDETDLGARLHAHRANALRLAPDPAEQGLLAREALDAGMPVADVAAALGCPASTVEALVRVVTEGSEAVIDLLKSGTVDVATAKLVVQQPEAVQTVIIEAVKGVAAQAAASESGEVVMEEISQKPVARKTEGGKVKVSKTFVETTRNAAKGKSETARDATKPGKSAKSAPESVPAPAVKGKPDALSIRAAALAAIPAADVINDKEYLRGVADAMSLLLGEGTPSHPAFAILMKRLARR
jgi:ParB-like chromosome segregation protein Spo0J